jgi:hypothetical protein
MPPHADDVRVIAPTFLSAQMLTMQGLSRRHTAQCVRDGRLLSVRRDRYVPAATPRDVIRAARLGGRVDCVTLLSMLGVFVLEDRELHMQVTVGASSLPPRPPGVKRHWRETKAGREDLHADLIEALAQSCRCQEPRAAVATLDSAWHLGLIDEDDLAEIFGRLPARFRGLRRLLDRRSECGPESIMRLMLRMIGCRIEVQPLCAASDGCASSSTDGSSSNATAKPITRAGMHRSATDVAIWLPPRSATPPFVRSPRTSCTTGIRYSRRSER